MDFVDKKKVNFSRNFVLEILLDSILKLFIFFSLLDIQFSQTIVRPKNIDYSMVTIKVETTREAEAIKNFAKYCFCLFVIEVQ